MQGHKALREKHRSPATDGASIDTVEVHIVRSREAPAAMELLTSLKACVILYAECTTSYAMRLDGDEETLGARSPERDLGAAGDRLLVTFAEEPEG